MYVCMHLYTYTYAGFCAHMLVCMHDLYMRAYIWKKLYVSLCVCGHARAYVLMTRFRSSSRVTVRKCMLDVGSRVSSQSSQHTGTNLRWGHHVILGITLQTFGA